MIDAPLQLLVEKIAKDTEYTRGRVDCLDKKLNEFKLLTEHRVTKLEVRAGLVALLVSAVVSAAIAYAR